MASIDSFTKDEAAELIRVKQDIQSFLRLAGLRMANCPERLPFKAVFGHMVIGWLLGLSDRYGRGEDITT